MTRADLFSDTRQTASSTLRLAEAIAGRTGREDDDYRRAAIGLAALRTTLGVVALVLPGKAGRSWIGAGATGRDRAVLLRALGGRDVALGVGALLAARDGREFRRWLIMGSASDLVDALATTVGFSALPKLRRWLVLLASAGAAVAGIELFLKLAPSASNGGR